MDAFLPELPPEGGPALARAGRLTEDNYARERIPGPAEQGLPGDYFMANDRIRVIIQQPGRSIGPVPYGGNIIDMDFVDHPQGDQLGEVGLFLLTGRTAHFRTAEIVRDGSAGGPAVIRFRGADVLDDYIAVQALGPVAGIIADEMRAEIELGLRLAVTYVLRPGASYVDTIYTFYNPGAVEVRTSWGTITDSGAQLSTYHPGTGFGGLDLAAIFTQRSPLAEYMAQQGVGLSYGVVPWPGVPDPAVGGVGFPVSGVVVEVYDVRDKLEVFGQGALTLVLPPRGGAERRVAIGVGRGGVDSIERLVRTEVRPAPLLEVRGRIAGTVPGEELHVGVLRAGPEGGFLPYTALRLAGEAGRDATSFVTALPSGQYRLVPEGAGPRRGDPVMLTLSREGAEVALALPRPGRLAYRILDEQGRPMPGKISIVGAPLAEDPAVSSPYERNLPGLVAVHHALRGDSDAGGRWDHPLVLPPGAYRVVVSHGPEWTRHEERVSLQAGGEVRVVARLAHAVPTPGYVACDFHQHTVRSPDSAVLVEDRVVTYLAEGVDFVSTSDHDVITDLEPAIAALGAADHLDSVPGVEMTPFGYGHFISFPLPFDPLSPTGGAFDWGGGEEANIAPAGIFAGVRALGARVVQVNHPRTPAPSTLDFLANFDRGVLRFDFARRTFYGDRAAMRVSLAQLGLPEDAEVFSDQFDALEVLNGGGATPPDRDGERRDPGTERVLRDWMNFLSFGFTPTATGTSDTHGIVRPAGVPRSLVRVPDDSPAAIAAGIGDEVVRTVSGQGGTPRDVIVTNGPFLQLWAGEDPARGGIGRTVSLSGSKLRITAEVRTVQWAPVDTLEVFANRTFLDNGAEAEPLVPALCFTSRPMMSARCRAAVVSGPLQISRVDEGGGRVYLRARIEVEVEVERLLAQNRPGARGRDLWLVARAFGDHALFPVLPGELARDVSIASLLDGAPVTTSGLFPLAFTNPVFVDVDGGGWRGPFQP